MFRKANPRFHGMLLRALGTSMLGNKLTWKGVLNEIRKRIRKYISHG